MTPRVPPQPSESGQPGWAEPARGEAGPVRMGRGLRSDPPQRPNQDGNDWGSNRGVAARQGRL